MVRSNFTLAQESECSGESAAGNRLAPVQVRRTAPPTAAQVSLFRNLRRDVWVVSDPEAYGRDLESAYGNS